MRVPISENISWQEQDNRVQERPKRERENKVQRDTPKEEVKQDSETESSATALKKSNTVVGRRNLKARIGKQLSIITEDGTNEQAASSAEKSQIASSGSAKKSEQESSILDNFFSYAIVNKQEE